MWLVHVAWLERRVSLACAPAGDPVQQIEDLEVPSWFVAKELGLAFDQGPSILWTLEHLEEINRTHRRLLAEAQAPQRVRQSVLRRLRAERVSRRRLLHVLARAGILVRGGRYVDARTGRALVA